VKKKKNPTTCSKINFELIRNQVIFNLLIKRPLLLHHSRRNTNKIK